MKCLVRSWRRISSSSGEEVSAKVGRVAGVGC